tara:strand:+ start:1764 stop:2429 length:666 start_codon:yes stop_codon:yes gene_type:complete
MKKLQIIILTILFTGLTMPVNSAELKAGLTVGGIAAKATGREISRTVEVRDSEDVEAVLGSIFAEVDLGMVSVGVDWIPYDIDGETVSNNRTCGGSWDCQTNQAKITLEDNYGIYVIVDLGDTGAYVKAMGTSHQVITEEDITNLTTAGTGGTASTYPDTDILGGHLSIGFEKDMDMFFVRGEVGISEWEKAVSKSSSGNTTVDAQLENGSHVKLSIGKAF